MIYFVSDIHLGAGSSEQARSTEQAFCRWLDTVAVDAKAIYLMGDIFDFWYEYKRVVPKGFIRVLGRLAALTDRGVEVHMFVGNHDMWCGDYLTKECGVIMHFAPEVAHINGRRLHLAHGDNMNIDKEYALRLMNTTFRSTIARYLFGWLVHPDLALRFGHWWSGKSRKSHSKADIGPEHLTFLVDYARNRAMSDSEIECFIFGHMHYTYEYNESKVRVLFMSDWSKSVASYVAMDDSGAIELKNFNLR